MARATPSQFTWIKFDPDNANFLVSYKCQKINVSKIVALWLLDNKCHLCGHIFKQVDINMKEQKCVIRSNTQKPTKDHIIARYAGGSDHFSNLALACKSCNMRRGSILIEWFR